MPEQSLHLYNQFVRLQLLQPQSDYPNPILHNLFSGADDNRWRWWASVGTNSFDNSQRLAIFRTSGIQFLDMCWNNHNLTSWTPNSHTGFIHIKYIFGTLDAIFCKGILVIEEEALEIFFSMSSDTNMGNWLCLDRMEMRVALYPLLEPSTGWWIAVFLLAKMADSGINYGWCSTQTHFYLVLTESKTACS